MCVAELDVDPGELFLATLRWLAGEAAPPGLEPRNLHSPQPKPVSRFHCATDAASQPERERRQLSWPSWGLKLLERAAKST